MDNRPKEQHDDPVTAPTTNANMRNWGRIVHCDLTEDPIHAAKYTAEAHAETARRLRKELDDAYFVPPSWASFAGTLLAAGGLAKKLFPARSVGRASLFLVGTYSLASCAWVLEKTYEQRMHRNAYIQWHGVFRQSMDLRNTVHNACFMQDASVLSAYYTTMLPAVRKAKVEADKQCIITVEADYQKQKKLLKDTWAYRDAQTVREMFQLSDSDMKVSTVCGESYAKSKP